MSAYVIAQHTKEEVMCMNVTTQCYLLTKCDRINRTLDKLIDYCNKEKGVITTEELAEIIKNVQKFIARELTINN